MRNYFHVVKNKHFSHLILHGRLLFDMDVLAEVRRALCHFLYLVAFLLQPDELTSLLVVMLYDLQERKFQAREVFDEEEPVAEVQKIEHYLYRCTH